MLEDLVWAPDSANPSGIGSAIYIAKRSDIASVPDYAAAPATAEDEVSLAVGDIVMQAAKTFSKLYSSQGKGKFYFESAGEKDAKLFKVMVDLSYPDIDAKSKALAISILNANCVLLVPTLIAGEGIPKYVMIGGHAYDTEIDAKGTSGDAPGSAKGLTLTVSSFDIVPGKVYKGVVELSDGSIDLSTGVFTPAIP